MKYKTGMVFGIYDKIEERHKELLRAASRLCDLLYIAVSSDEEVVALFKKPSAVPQEERRRKVQEYCKQEKINAVAIRQEGTSWEDLVKEFYMDAYVLSKNQYERFGKELEEYVKKHHAGIPDIVKV